VRHFEVVLANGSIAQVNSESHPDLYWALRGGGAGFGIVTRFDLETHPLSTVWGNFNAQLASDAGLWARKHGHIKTPSSAVGRVLDLILPYVTSLACKFGYCSTIDDMIERTWDMLQSSRDDLDSQSYGFVTLLDYMDVTGFHLTNTKGNANVQAFNAARKGRKIITSSRVEHGLAPFADEMSKITRQNIHR
jgi:hypothetical protein